MIKTITEYQELAKRTCPTLGSLDEDLVHMKLGVFTEIGELLDVIKKHLAYGKVMDVVNVGEEIADVVWYMANEATFNGIMIREDLGGWNRTHMIPLATTHNIIDNCQDLMAFYCGYVEDQSKHIHAIDFRVYLMKEIADYFELDFMQILTNNINKLKVRYPDKFDTDKAINRNLDRERIELEK